MIKQQRTIEQRLESLEQQVVLLQQFVIDLDNADEKNYDRIFNLLRDMNR